MLGGPTKSWEAPGSHTGYNGFSVSQTLRSELEKGAECHGDRLTRTMRRCACVRDHCGRYADGCIDEPLKIGIVRRELMVAPTLRNYSRLVQRRIFRERVVSAVAESINANTAEHDLTDGFHLLIDALKLNGIETIYGVPGIPITDLGRMAQAAGIRVISFRHEQNAGNAAAIAGFLTKKPGVCLTVSAPGFLNGLTALANATTNCFPMILISGSSEREIVDLQQGDYEEMDQLAIAKPLCKAAFRVLHAADIGIGLAPPIRAAASRRPRAFHLQLAAKL